MACTNAIVAMAVMYSSPSRLNRHGGVALASIVPPALLQARGPAAKAESLHATSARRPGRAASPAAARAAGAVSVRRKLCAGHLAALERD